MAGRTVCRMFFLGRDFVSSLLKPKKSLKSLFKIFKTQKPKNVKKLFQKPRFVPAVVAPKHRSKRRCLASYDYRIEVTRERTDYDLFCHSCSEYHCLNHIYMLNEKPPGSVTLRTRGRVYTATR